MPITLPPTAHYEFANSHICDCYLCSRWRRWLNVLSKAEQLSEGHSQGCKCDRCHLLRLTRNSTLAAELRLNLWIELGWYSSIENWNSGWEQKAWQELQQPDKWWIVTGQYKSISYWLEKFDGKEQKYYDYTDPNIYKNL